MGWFPRISSQGHVIAGSGQLSLDGRSLGITGWGPCWIRPAVAVYNDDHGTSTYNIATGEVKKLDTFYANELDAKEGGVAAFWHPVVIKYGIQQIQGAGAPQVNLRGDLAYVLPRQEATKSVYLNGVKVQTFLNGGRVSLTNQALVWNGDGHISYKLGSAPIKIHPPLKVRQLLFVSIDTPDGPWLARVSDKGAMVGPLGSTKGHYWTEPGWSQILNPHAMCIGREVHVVYNSDHGVTGQKVFSIDAPLEELSGITESGPMEPPPVGIPNHLDVVQRARVKYASLSGVERAGKIVNQVAWDLKAEGAGAYAKTSGTNYQGRSVDIIIYKPGGETFDILGDAEGNADPQWGRTTPTGLGDVNLWRAATDPGGVIEPPPPPPPPTGTTLDDVMDMLQKQNAVLMGILGMLKSINDQQKVDSQAIADIHTALTVTGIPVTLTGKLIGLNTTLTGKAGGQ